MKLGIKSNGGVMDETVEVSRIRIEILTGDGWKVFEVDTDKGGSVTVKDQHGVEVLKVTLLEEHSQAQATQRLQARADSAFETYKEIEVEYDNEKQRADRLQAEVDRLQRLKVHCSDCGADYAATGIEAGCPCKLRIVMQGLVDALSGLVKCNEEWNEAVASIIGKPEKWSDTYLNEARTALEAAKPFLKEPK